MKNEFIWAKTLLCVYRYLERIAGAIDKIVMQKALGSGHVSSLNFNSTCCESVANEILDLMERKVKLVNLKVLVEDCLTDMREKDATLLVDKFVGGMKLADLVEKYDSSMRNIFRKQDIALARFENQLKIRGFDDERLEKETSGEEWIRNVYSKFESKEKEVVLSNLALVRAVR